MMFQYKKFLSFFLAILFSASTMHPCAIYVLNDTQHPIILVDKNGSTSMILEPMTAQAIAEAEAAVKKVVDASGGNMNYVIKNIPLTYFGNPNKHGYFRVMTQDFEKQPGHYAARVVVQQTACSRTHAILLKASDLLNQKITEENTGVVTVQQYTLNEQKEREQKRIIKEQEGNGDMTNNQDLASLSSWNFAFKLADNYDSQLEHAGFRQSQQQKRQTSGDIPNTEYLTEDGVDIQARKRACPPEACPACAIAEE